MSDFRPLVLDLGYDYGATGGPDNFGAEVVESGSTESVNQTQSRTRGEWEIGSRTVNRAQKDYLLDFWHAVRGQVYRFLYLDWTDHLVEESVLQVSGATCQLTKSYGVIGTTQDGFENDDGLYYHPVYKPKGAGSPFLIDGYVETSSDGGTTWVKRYDYVTAGPTPAYFSVDQNTGIVTWLAGIPVMARWTGKFYKIVRFQVPRIRFQFLAYEDRENGPEAFYDLGPLSVRESLKVP